jgi:ribosomal protein S21
MDIDPLHATNDEVEKANAELKKRVHRRGGFTQKGTREWKEMKKEKKETKQAAKRERRGWKPKDPVNPAAN